MRIRAATRSPSSSDVPERLWAAGDVARGLAAAGVLLSAAVHLELWDVLEYRHIHVIGPLFLLNAIGGLIIGVVVLVWRHWLPALAAAGFGAATLSAFWLSVTRGLFGFTESATGSAQILAEIAEIVAVLFGLTAAVLSRWHMRQALRSPTEVGHANAVDIDHAGYRGRREHHGRMQQ